MEMKQYYKLTVFVLLTLIATISLSSVFAQPAIGATAQYVPFESSPTTHATDKSGPGVPGNPGNAYDKDWSTTFAQVPLTGNALFPPDLLVRYFEVKAFETPSPAEFDPGWVDIKIRFSCPATTDDKYRIVYRVDPDTTWYVLPGQDWVSAAAAEAKAGLETIARDWHDVAEPNDNAWDWTDVGNLVVRVETQQQTGNDAKSINLYEVWADVYPLPKPLTASTAISIQPSVVMDIQAGETFFVDVYAMGVTGPGVGTYQVTIEYDTNLVTGKEFYTYAPFISMLPSGIDDVAGTVGVAAYTFMGDTVGFTGGNTTLCRVYFEADSGGVGNLTITFGELKQVGIEPIYPPTYGCFVSADRFLSAVGSQPKEIDLTNPLDTKWHELYPDYCKNWTLTSWEDTQPEGEPGYGELSKSDQIDMKNETEWTYWFHVDEVTVTIHWTFKEGTEEIGAAEPSDIPEYGIPAWNPDEPPVYTGFHQIYPVYSRDFIVTDWTDTDGSNTLTPSDQFQITYADDFSAYYAHLDAVSTDILVSQKPIPPEPPPVPEFPLGLGLMIAIAPAIPVVYLWRNRKKVVR